MLNEKKNLFLLMVIIVCSIFFLLNFIHTQTAIPKLTVTYNGKSLEVGQGSYYWKSRLKTKEFNVPSYASILTKLTPPKTLDTNGDLELHFDYQPKTIALSGGYVQDNSPILENNTIHIKKKDSIQIYFLNCTWKEGTVTYIIVA